MAGVTRSGSGVTFDFRTDPPLKEFQFKLSRFTEGLSDFTPMFERIGGVFRQQEKKQFQSEGALGSGRWAKLSDNPAGAGYASWKKRHYPGRKIGVLTGALASSMTGGRGYSQKVSKTSASFGMDPGSAAVHYGRYFSEGTEKMPARPLIVATSLRGKQLQKTATTWVREEAHHAGLIGWGSKTFSQELPSMSYQESLPGVL